MDPSTTATCRLPAASLRRCARPVLLGVASLALLGAAGATLEFLGKNEEAGLAGAFGVAVSPDGAHVYAVGFDEGALLTYARDEGDGTLTALDVIRDGDPGVDGLAGATRVLVSPDGLDVYVTGFSDDALAAFERDPVTGLLTFLAFLRDMGQTDGLADPEGLAISPDGAHIYTAASAEAEVGVFARDAETGAVDFVEAVTADGLLSASSVAVSPDGLHVYATGLDDDAVVAFSRDGTTGELTWIETIRNDMVVDGLLGARDVAVSPDGESVYVAGNFDAAIAVFSRDAGTGQLTWLEVERDNVNGVNGLDSADRVVVSHDGSQVYATGCFEDSVVVFDRDPATGELDFVERNLVQSTLGFGAFGLAVSPDDANVYATGQIDDALAVFRVVPEPGSAASAVAAAAVLAGLAARRRRGA